MKGHRMTRLERSLDVLRFTAILYTAWTIVKFLSVLFVPAGSFAKDAPPVTGMAEIVVMFVLVDTVWLAITSLAVGNAVVYVSNRLHRNGCALDPETGKSRAWLFIFCAFAAPVIRLEVPFPAWPGIQALWIAVAIFTLLAILLAERLRRATNRAAIAEGQEALRVPVHSLLLWAAAALACFFPFPSLFAALLIGNGMHSPTSQVLIALWWATTPALIFATLLFFRRLARAQNACIDIVEAREAARPLPLAPRQMLPL